MHRSDRCHVTIATRLLLVWDKEIIRREAPAAGTKAGAAFMHKGGFSNLAAVRVLYSRPR